MKVAGEIDALDAAGFREAISRVGTRDRLVIDLSELTFVDSAGLHALFSIGRAAGGAGSALAIVVPPGSPVHKVIDLVRLDEVAPVCQSLELAVERLAAGAGDGVHDTKPG